MIINFKSLGLATVATLCLGAFVAQGASAVPLTVEGGGATTYLTGNQAGTIKFSTPNGTVSCTGNSVSGKSAGTSINEMTLAPTMTGCSAYGFAIADVTVNGCTYTFTTPTAVVQGRVTWGNSQTHISCPVEQYIEVTPTTFGISACTQFFMTQTPTGGHVMGINVSGSSPASFEFNFTLSGIHYNGTGGLCGNEETHSDATLNGSSTVKCYKNSSHTEQVGCKFS